MRLPRAAKLPMSYFRLLRDPASYVAHDWDLLADTSARKHWLDHFAKHFEVMLSHAATQYGRKAAKSIAAARQQFTTAIDQLRSKPALAALGQAEHPGAVPPARRHAAVARAGRSVQGRQGPRERLGRGAVPGGRPQAARHGRQRALAAPGQVRLCGERLRPGQPGDDAPGRRAHGLPRGRRQRQGPPVADRRLRPPGRGPQARAAGPLGQGGGLRGQRRQRLRPGRDAAGARAGAGRVRGSSWPPTSCPASTTSRPTRPSRCWGTSPGPTRTSRPCWRPACSRSSPPATAAR